MIDLIKDKERDDDYIESQFLFDYSAFGLRVNLRAIESLYEQASNTDDILLQKSLCISGMQFMFSSYEDLALLLHGVLKKKNDKIHLHLSLEYDKRNKGGSAFVPKIFKRYTSAKELLDRVGLSSITLETYNEMVGEVTEQQYEDHFQDLAESIKQIGEYQVTFNIVKNRLKHGKAIFGEEATGELSKFVTYYSWDDAQKFNRLDANHLDVSIEQFQIALIHVKKIYTHSIEILWLFVIQYHPPIVNDFEKHYMKLLAEIC